MNDDRSYFLKRAAEERSAAAASEGKARSAHEQMAERYQLLAEAGTANEDTPQPVTNLS